MVLVVKELDANNLEDVGKVDGYFVIDSQLVLQAENNQIHYTVSERPAKQKRYAQEEIDYSAYMNDPEKAIFLAYVEGSLAGQIILRKNWNNLRLRRRYCRRREL